jgi:hypothetical protein
VSFEKTDLASALISDSVDLPLHIASSLVTRKAARKEILYSLQDETV